MKTSVSHLAVLLSAILLSSLFPSEPALAQGCPTPSFGPARTFAAGINSISVAVGDFNGDGKADLIAVNEGTNAGSVSVLLGNGDGTFQAPVNYATGAPISYSVALGDFNADGSLDVAVGNFGALQNIPVSVLLGNGDGTFQPADFYEPEDISSYSVTVGDFDGDGNLDLVTVDGFNWVWVLLGNGDGTFQAAVKYVVGARCTSVAVGDFNGDGKPDLAVADYVSTNLWVLLGNGDGTFQAPIGYAAGTFAEFVAVGDFNDDGKSDLAVALRYSGVSVLLGNGDGTFQTALFSPLGNGDDILSVAVADFNGDGKPDLAVPDALSTNLWVLLGNGDGTFQTAVSYGAGSRPRVVAVGDFNGDGKPDLAVANNLTAGYVSVLLNTCSSIGPDISITRTNFTITLAWPFPSTGFLLESTPTLSPPNWQPAVEAPLTNNGLLEVMVPVNPGSRYFRLHKP